VRAPRRRYSPTHLVLRGLSRFQLSLLGSNQDSPDPEGPLEQPQLQQLATIFASSCHPMLEFAGFDARLCRTLLAQMSGFVTEGLTLLTASTSELCLTSKCPRPRKPRPPQARLAYFSSAVLAWAGRWTTTWPGIFATIPICLAPGYRGRRVMWCSSSSLHVFPPSRDFSPRQMNEAELISLNDQRIREPSASVPRRTIRPRSDPP